MDYRRASSAINMLAIMRRILIILTIFIIGCGTVSKVTTTSAIVENNRDVLILSNLIQDYLKRTDGRVINIDELMQNDTLGRISNNFEKTELINHASYISVYYKRSKSRGNKIELTNKEREMLNWMKWKEKKLSGQYDGEIRFDFGERFYHVKKIIVKKE